MNQFSLSQSEVLAIEKKVDEWQRLRDPFIYEDIPFKLEDLSLTRSFLYEMSNLIDTTRPIKFWNHRPVVGTLISFTKNTVIRFVTFILKPYLTRQSLFNTYVWRMGVTVALLEDRIAELEKKLDERDRGTRPS